MFHELSRNCVILIQIIISENNDIVYISPGSISRFVKERENWEEKEESWGNWGRGVKYVEGVAYAREVSVVG